MTNDIIGHYDNGKFYRGKSTMSNDIMFRTSSNLNIAILAFLIF